MERSHDSLQHGNHHQTSVLIVGGGPTGLILSALLSQYAVPSILIEARKPEVVAQHPQAHYINLRSMEIIRHNFPNLYLNVLRNISPSTEWNAFTFSHSILGRQIARVVHPVENLRIGQDGNGRLVEDQYMSDIEYNTDSYGKCSPCETPGHLAQNIFSTLLLNEARTSLKLFQNSHPITDRADIIHGMTVTNITDYGYEASYPISVHTSCGHHIEAKYIVAADGSLSLTRSLHGHRNIMVGEHNIQHLINVHFQTSPSLSAKLMKHRDRIGMLHFVYNSNFVGAYVCHNLQQGEWVLQIPFFPPFDSIDDFTEEKVRSLITVGILNDSSEFNTSDVNILHVKPWSMSALVSESYLLGKSKRIILAGDSAHVFPPAGGFGMNTGLQDSHDLSWRLALLCGRNDAKSCMIAGVPNLLLDYELERKQIASINAALSIRNYKRTLDIAKACFLNANHPALLKAIMENPPVSFLPFSLRADAFKLAVRTALKPLSELSKQGSLLGESMVRNIRRILQSGGGLPLLFPRYELGFQYGSDKSSTGQMNDTEGYYPSFSNGCRLPHVNLYLVGYLRPSFHEIIPASFMSTSNKEMIKDHEKELSLTDLESQLTTRWIKSEKPHFMLIAFCAAGMFESASFNWHLNTATGLLKTSNITLDIVEIFEVLEEAMSRMGVLNRTQPSVSVSIMYDQHKAIQTILEKTDNKDDGKLHGRSFFIIARPDGHISYRAIIENEVPNSAEQLYEEIVTNLLIKIVT